MKRNSDGSLDHFKARLVAQGYTQTDGIDYEEVFAPVAKYSTILSLLTLANAYDLEVHQLDVNTAFLNVSLEHDIYMSQPEGLIDPNRPNYVCKLNKSIYGPKQSARCWNSTLDEFLTLSGYRRSAADECNYIKQIKNSNDKISFVILAVYVDDMLPVSNDIDFLNAEKKSLCDRFEMTDQGEVHCILGRFTVSWGCPLNRQAKPYYVYQSAEFCQGHLKCFKMENNAKFHKLSDKDEPFDTQTYQQAIGCLTYLATVTCPDISVTVSALSKYISCPHKSHWTGVKRITRYLKGTIDFGLKFSCVSDENPQVIGYSDADWAGDLDTCRSTSGYVYQIGQSAVSWCSKRQTTVAKSTTEAEYVALNQATQEAVWLRHLLADLGYSMNSPTTVFEDNQGAIELSKNAKFQNRTKHIDVAYHFVREKIYRLASWHGVRTCLKWLRSSTAPPLSNGSDLKLK